MIGEWTVDGQWSLEEATLHLSDNFLWHKLCVGCVRLRRQQYSWCVVTYEWSCNQPTRASAASDLRLLEQAASKIQPIVEEKSVLHLFMSEPLIKQSLVESAKCDFCDIEVGGQYVGLQVPRIFFQLGLMSG